jgi:hypothetical protein
MDAEEIQALRAMLAAQAAEDAAKRPTFGFLTRLSNRRPRAEAASFGLQHLSTAEPDEEATDAPALCEPLDEPMQAALLLGDLAPRRLAFGQREAALELSEPAPREPARLMLTAPNGVAVGEIILHETPSPLRPGPFDAVQIEAPFFPEDLEDAPGRAPPRRLIAPMPLPAPSPRPAAGGKSGRKAKPTRETASAYLLARLAARLAHEAAALQARLTAVGAGVTA